MNFQELLKNCLEIQGDAKVPSRFEIAINLLYMYIIPVRWGEFATFSRHFSVYISTETRCMFHNLFFMFIRYFIYKVFFMFIRCRRLNFQHSRECSGRFFMSSRRRGRNLQDSRTTGRIFMFLRHHGQNFQPIRSIQMAYNLCFFNAS